MTWQLDHSLDDTDILVDDNSAQVLVGGDVTQRIRSVSKLIGMTDAKEIAERITQVANVLVERDEREFECQWI